MKLLASMIVAAACLAQEAAKNGAPAVTVLEGVRVKLLLGPEEVRQLGGKLSGGFEVSARGRLLIGIETAAGRNLVVPDIGVRLLTKDDSGLETFRRVGDGALIATCDRQLARLENGELIREVDLPAAGMRLAPSRDADAFYVYGGRAGSGGVVYRILRGRRCENLVEAPAAVTALTEIGGRLYFAMGAEVVGLSRRGALSSVYDPPAEAQPVLALAGDAAMRTLFMATADSVIALRGGRAVTLLAGCGGELRLGGGSLYVLDAHRGLVIQVPEIAAQLGGSREP